MTIWDEIRAEMIVMPGFLKTTDDIFEGLQMGMAFMPIRCVGDTALTRLAFVKFAAIAVRGIELLNAEFDTEVDDEEPV